MRKPYGDYSHSQRPTWAYVLIALGLLWLIGKPFVFPLLVIAGLWWMFARKGCAMHWQNYRHHHFWQDWQDEYHGKSKSKSKNDDLDWDEDSDYVIV